MVVVTRLAANDPLLGDVIQLWRANSATLGFFPEGAFRERAEQGQILVATSVADGLVGYLAYRRTRDRVAIIHLCVAEAQRGRSIARLLVERLCEEVRTCAGISLRCRRDFHANRLWSSLCFEAVNELRGRGRDREWLTVWYRDLGNPDLFRQPRSDGAVRAAIDANVFFDLYDDEPQGVESRALLADWVGEVADLYVTKELSNEIDRAGDPDVRRRHRSSMTSFQRCEPLEPGGYEQALAVVTEVLPPPDGPNDESDRRHLAWAAAAGVEYFLTRDEAILEFSNELFDRLQILAVRPSEFVLRIDECERAEEYAPARLAGTSLKWKLVQSGDEERIANALQSGREGERKAEFLARLRELTCDPRRYEVRGVFQDEARVRAVLAFDASRTGVLQIPLLRVARGTAALTLARHLLYKAQCRAVEAQADVIELSCLVPGPELLPALELEGWLRGDDGVWRKWTPAVVGDVGALRAKIRGSAAFSTEHARPVVAEVERLLNPAYSMPGTVAAVERLLWPAKVLGGGLPTFVVPIKPAYAEHIVDERLAQQGLFGARDDLALNREAVYYRSQNRPAPEGPCRVLWYVTNDTVAHGVKTIRACSTVEEVVIGPGNDLYRRFRRYGVYSWRDIRQLVEESDDGQIMALRFGSTRLLPAPVGLGPLREIRARQDRGVLHAGPMEIEDAEFAEICARGGLA